MAAFLTPVSLTLAASHPHTLASSSLHGLRLTHHISTPTRVHFLPKMQLGREGIEEEEDPFEGAPVTEETKLFVGNLSWSTTDSSLGEAFARYGTVVDAKVVTDRFTGKSRGFGFIEYDAADSAAEALEGMNGVEVDGRIVRVDRANRRLPRQRRPQNNYY